MLAGFLVGMLVAWRMHAFDSIFDGNTEPLGLVHRRRADAGRRRHRRPPRGVAAGQGRRHRAVGQRAGDLAASACCRSASRSWARSSSTRTGRYLLSVIWVLGMANAINLIDGLDGLAAGIVAIAAGTFFLYAMQLAARRACCTEGNIGPLIAILVLGMCLGFLPWNVHPAKIFMGDGGALLLGLLMAASTMVVGGRTDQPFSGQTFFFFAPVLIPLVILGVPDLRHRLVDRAPGPHPHEPGHRRQGPPAPPPHAARSRPPAQRVHPVGVDRAAVGLRALPDLHPLRRRHRPDRHPGPRPAALHRAAPAGPPDPSGRHRGRPPRRWARPRGRWPPSRIRCRCRRSEAPSP